MKRVLVTGAAGFIGFHLCRRLRERGDEVLGFDNLNDYYDPSLKRARIDLLKKSDVEVVTGDLCDAEALEQAAEQLSATHCVNLAAQAGVRYSLENPQAYISSNIQGFLNILELCRKRPSMPLVYASSSSVYGLNDKSPFAIDDRTDHQASLYGATKKSNELFAHSYHHLFDIKVTGLRFFTVYGPWGRPDMAYYSFTDKIMSGEPIQVFNHGKMLRDFTYIDDIIQGTTAAIDLEANCEVFNLGNNSPVELGHFIDVLETSLGKKAEKQMLPMQAGDVTSTYADIEYSREKLGFQPTTSLEDGIPRFVDWYRHYHQHMLEGSHG